MPVGIVAINAVHSIFDDWMMLWKAELGMSVQMTIKTRCRILPRIDDKFSSAAPSHHMFAAGSVTTFTSSGACELDLILVKSAMCTRCEDSSDVGMAVSESV